MSELPKGWVETSIEEIGEITAGFGFPDRFQGRQTGELPFAKVRDISHAYQHNKGRLIGAANYIIRDDLVDLKAKTVSAGSVAFAKIGEALKLNRRVLLDVEAVLDNNCMAVTPHRGVIQPQFLYRFMTTVDFTPFAVATTVPSIRKGDVGNFRIPLPPLAEQKRIVAKLDALNAKSARARTELARIETLVSRYKQAVLSKAFSGELIGLKPTATTKPHALCWNLPASWRWVSFEDAVEIASNLVSPATIPDLPHIAPDNIEGATTRLLPFRTIGEDGVISAKHRFYPDQVLYSKIRPYLRKAVIVDFDGACSADMYPLTARPSLSARYLLQWLVSEQFTQFAIEHQGRTVLPKINQNALNQTPLPLPPLTDQHEIVRRIESAFARIDRLAAQAKRALELVGKLDEAILAKAFRGELVPQDDNDEPAEKLLERIRAERAAAPKVKRGRGRKA